MSNQVNPLAEKIAHALVRYQIATGNVYKRTFTTTIDTEDVETGPVMSLDAIKEIIAPLLPEGDGWQARAEKAEAELKTDAEIWDECHAALTAAGIPETEKSPMGEDCLLSLESRIKKLIEAKAEGDGWIPCAERLPEIGELVDVVANDIAQKLPAYLSGKGFANEDGFEWLLEVITHWHKRPTFTLAPPAEGQPVTKEIKTQEKKP